MDPFYISLIGIATLVAVIFLGVPIGFSFAAVGFSGIVCIKGLKQGLIILGIAPFSWASQITLVVLPLFILMGQFAFHSRISQDLYECAYKFMGRFPGGLALATNLACTGFAACSGSSLASAATMATISYPEMKKYNYPPSFASGVIASGGTLGILIPPSTIFIIYGVLTMTSIGKLFIAGVLPGIMLSGMFLILIYLICRKNANLRPPQESYSLLEKLKSLSKVWGMLTLFLLVMGGLFAGLFSPSEAGAIGAIGAFIIIIVRGRLKVQVLMSALKETVQITCMIFTVLIGAMIFSAFLTVSGLPATIQGWVLHLDVPPIVVVISILLIYIPLGMIMDSLPMILLTIPMLFPVVTGLGYDPVWFGVLVVLMSEIALISPPVGMNAYIVSGVTQVPLQKVFLGVLPFMLVMYACVGILIAFPQVSLFLPSILK